MGRIRTGVRRRVNRTKAWGSRNSAEILMVGFGVTSLLAFGLAIKATVDIQEEWDDLTEDIDDIRDSFDRDEETYEYYDEEDDEVYEIDGEEAVKEYRKDLAKAHGKRILCVAKHYAIPVALEITAVGMGFGSNQISRKRNAKLSTALSVSQAAYSSLKKNLIGAVGEEEAENIEMGLKKEKIKKKVTDPETGKKKTVEEEIYVPIDEEGIVKDPWVIKITPEYKQIWQNSWKLMVEILELKENFWNQIMVSRSHEDRAVWYNEIVEDLGIAGRKEGQIFGYKYNKYDDNPDYINFGIRVVQASEEDKLKYNVDRIVYLNLRPRRVIDECYRPHFDEVAMARNQWNKPGDFAGKGIRSHTF